MRTRPGPGTGTARRLLPVLVALLPLLGVGCRTGTGDIDSNARVIVLGFDGMDYALTQRMMSEGRLPHFERLARTGSFSPLGTSIPPQSPVAWSDFITGMDAGGHGIFDFIHRDPRTMLPYLSTSRTDDSDMSLEIHKWKIPLAGGKVELLRRGQPFWEVLDRRGIDTTIIRMPANYPPSGSAHRELSGMGTPDLLGNYGTFSFFTTNAAAFAGRRISGGKVFPADPVNNVVKLKLYGPDNPFLVDPEKLETPVTVYVDNDEPVAKIVVGDEERILRVGEWSNWVPITFDMIPTQSLSAMARFYLKSVEPEFELYVTPLNFDPSNPALPFSTPASYAADLARETGPFYTQGMPEDTKALSEGVLTRREFLDQARLVADEVIAQYRHVLDRFESGLLFYYFGNLDQISHMMWRPMDPGHPAYDAENDPPFRDVVSNIYEEFDAVVGLTLEKMGDDTLLIVMSDHGFTSWRRAFHLNSWLRESGYLTVKDPFLRDDRGLFMNVDWSRTRAYGLGLNGLYLNLRGREKNGIVAPQARQALMEEIAGKLLQVVDPDTGQPAVTSVFRREEAYEDRGEIEIGPDLIVGYAKRTRGSFESALGEVGPNVFTDNTAPWSGDHCMDPRAVPGVLLSSRPLRKPATELKNLASAILSEFGIEDFPTRRSGGAAGSP